QRMGLYIQHWPGFAFNALSNEAYLQGLADCVDAGLTQAVGVSNFNVEQLEAFHRICPIASVQPPYNMLQRQIEQDVLPWCLQNGVSLAVYWPLMKGLLAGKLPRDYVFAPGDGRAKYPMFHGEEWQRNQDFLDELRVIASELGRSVADVVVNWTIHQPGITVALCGAKRPDQIRESAAALTWRLSPEQLSRIDDALVRRGAPVSRPAV
ncbi:MAG: aldo/keto reductase, partial [Planctomycetota bacterium]